MPSTVELTPTQVHLLRAAVAFALTKYREHHKTLMQCARTGGNDLITPEAASRMAAEKIDTVQALGEVDDLLRRHPLITFSELS